MPTIRRRGKLIYRGRGPGIFKRENSPYWYANFSIAGQVFKRSTQETDIEKAKEVRDEMIAEVLRNEAVEVDIPPRVAAARAKRSENFGVIYFLQHDSFIKIGFTVDLKNRCREYNVSLPNGYKILAKLPGALATETAMHTVFEEYHHRGEWFRHEGRLAEFITHLARFEWKQPSESPAPEISAVAASSVLPLNRPQTQYYSGQKSL